MTLLGQEISGLALRNYFCMISDVTSWGAYIMNSDNNAARCLLEPWIAGCQGFSYAWLRNTFGIYGLMSTGIYFRMLYGSHKVVPWTGINFVFLIHPHCY